MSVDNELSKKLGELRAGIDSVDRNVLKLLNERAIEIGKLKEKAGTTAYVPAREEDLVRKLKESNDGPFPSEGIRPVWKEIISASLSLEHPLGVAYLGPTGTFTHEASRKQFGLSARYLPAKTITEVFDAVEKGKAEYGVIPVENTTEGSVSPTLDKFMESNTKIAGEVMLRISHNLMNKTGRASDIIRVYSHPQALGQCRKWLEANLPRATQVEASSTAEAARLAKEDPGGAAIASELAADLFDLTTLRQRIQDLAENATRFLVLGKAQAEPTGRDKTSLLLTAKDGPGILLCILQPFSDAGLNLTKIESRPGRRKAWQNVFFLDAEGHQQDKAMNKALVALRPLCEAVKVLGSYPRADRS